MMDGQMERPLGERVLAKGAKRSKGVMTMSLSSYPGIQLRTSLLQLKMEDIAWFSSNWKSLVMARCLARELFAEVLWQEFPSASRPRFPTSALRHTVIGAQDYLILRYFHIHIIKCAPSCAVKDANRG